MSSPKGFATNLPEDIKIESLKMVYDAAIKNLELATEMVSERDLEIEALKEKIQRMNPSKWSVSKWIDRAPIHLREYLKGYAAFAHARRIRRPGAKQTKVDE